MTIGKGVYIGPYCVVGPSVQLDDAVTLKAHVVVDGRTIIGATTTIYPFASISSAPQDLKYQGEPSVLIIGRNNTIREHVTMNPGTAGGGLRTVRAAHEQADLDLADDGWAIERVSPCTLITAPALNCRYPSPSDMQRHRLAHNNRES